MRLFSLAGRVLRAPSTLVDDAPHERLPDLLLLTCGGLATLGAILGSYRGGLQILYAAIKLPGVFLIPTLVCLPLVAAVADQDIPWRRVAMATMLGMARAALLASAAAPMVWVLWAFRPEYHLSIELMAGMLALAGTPGLFTIARLLPGTFSVRSAAMLVCAFGLVTAQTGWLLRPILVRPQGEITFLRPIESDVFSSLEATHDSTSGNYVTDWSPERAGFVGRATGTK